MLTAQHAIGSFSKGDFGVTRLLSMVQQLQIYDLSENRCLMSNPHALRHETYLESPGLYYMIMERPALQMRTVFFEKFLQRMREDLLSGSLKKWNTQQQPSRLPLAASLFLGVYSWIMKVKKILRYIKI